jgi:hypothetical protein
MWLVVQLAQPELKYLEPQLLVSLAELEPVPTQC